MVILIFIFGILDGDYAIWDAYLVFELFLLVYLVCWATYLIFGTPLLQMVHFRGPTVWGPICHFFGADNWAPDSWAWGTVVRCPICHFWGRTVGPQGPTIGGSICHFFGAESYPGPSCPGPSCPGPNCPGPIPCRKWYMIEVAGYKTSTDKIHLKVSFCNLPCQIFSTDIRLVPAHSCLK